MLKVHLSLPVRDLAATSAFYETLFDTVPTKRKDDYVKFEPEELALNISFTQVGEGRSIDPDRHHLGVEFSSQAALDDAFRRLSAAQLVADVRSSSICCYADQDKFHVRDPDGYEWEYYYLLADSAIRIDPQSTCCPSTPDTEACCS